MEVHKLLLLGDSDVGKSALLLQLLGKPFEEDLEPTIEDSNRKHITVDHKSCTIEVLDTGGYDCYAGSIPGWISDNDGFLLVYSIGSRESFARIFELLKVVRETAPKGPIVLAGNKCDDATIRQVQLGESYTLATENGCGFFETSARTGLNVEDAFSDLVRRLRGATIKEVTLVADSAGREGHNLLVALWHGVLACLRGCCSPRKLTAGGLRKSRYYGLQLHPPSVPHPQVHSGPVITSIGAQ